MENYRITIYFTIRNTSRQYVASLDVLLRMLTILPSTYSIKIKGIPEMPKITAHLPRSIPNSDCKIESINDAKTSLGRIKFKTVKIVPGSHPKFSPATIPATIHAMPKSEPITFSRNPIMYILELLKMYLFDRFRKLTPFKVQNNMQTQLSHRLHNQIIPCGLVLFYI